MELCQELEFLKKKKKNYPIYRLPNSQSNANANNCNASEVVSDSDESLNDDASLLKNCILMGIKAKTVEPGEFRQTILIEKSTFA